MKIKFLSFVAIFSIISSAAFSQSYDNNAVLMTIGNEKVTLGEFINVYKKNNTKDSKLDKKSLEEYLDLYTKFRLKVKEARELGIDTTKAFKDELAGYQKTLSAPYLTDKDAVDNLTKEAYDRMQWDIRTSHILIRVDLDATAADSIDALTRIKMIKDFIDGKADIAAFKKYEAKLKSEMKITKKSSPKDTLEFFNKINPLKKMFALKVHDFASVAKVVSEHSSKNEGGDLGYLTGMVGMGYPYEYESAAYKAKPGVIYGAFRSPMGYHLMLVTDKKPHKELRIAHLMLYFKKNMSHVDSLKLKYKIDSIYALCKVGKNFEDLVQQFSNHRESVKKGGDIGWVALSSNFPIELKEAAFALKQDGDVYKPVESKFGWHIVKRLGSRDLLPFDSLKTELKAKVQRDERNNIAKDMFISKLKKEYAFKEDAKAREEMYKAVDSTLFMGKWKAEKVSSMHKTMFTAAGKAYTQQDFAMFMQKNQRNGVQKNAPLIVNSLFRKFVDETLLDTKENHLEQDYPEFKMLMDEYKDGILLFNLTDQKVWSKAIKDTTGAKDFYEKNKDHFLWGERLDASIYTCKDEKTADKVQKFIKKGKSDKEILSELNHDSQYNVSIDGKNLFLKGDNTMLDKNWNPGVTPSEKVKDKIVFANVRKIVKPTPKTYNEARGLITSEYQTYLETEWINSLKAKYPVTINEKVLDSIQ